ncbi:MAG: Ig-like domain-containing protein, partial [Methylococcaceae bacterium]
GSPVTIDNNVTIAGGGSYTEGYVRFALASGITGDTFTLSSSGTPNVSGAISRIGSDVYLGNGSGTDRIGSIDAIENGLNGQPLKILFSSPIPNAGFEEGETNWTIKDEEYGNSANEINFDGYSIPLATNSDGNSTYSGGAGTVNVQLNNGTTFNGSVASGTGVAGTKALYLSSTGNIQTGDQNPQGPFQANGYGSIHGPYATSTSFAVQSGDSISLEFKAVGSGDDYEVFGLLRKVDGSGNLLSNSLDSNNIVLFAERGADTSGYKTVTHSGLTAGNYKFEFVGGTYDGSGGLLVGSNLYVDNIRLISSTTVNDSVVSTIAQQVQYQSTANDTPLSRTVSVTTANQNGEVSSAANITLNITQANNAPTFTSGATLAAVNEDSTPVGATVSSLFNSLYSDPDTAITPADSLAGIAIVGDASSGSQGTWQYSTDSGSNWYSVGAVSTSSALLLSTSALVRFLPAGDFNGAPGNLSVHAVDSTNSSFTAGATRQTFNTTTDDSASAVSASAVTLGTSISSVNDAPTFTSAAVTLSVSDTGINDTYSASTGSITAQDTHSGAPNENGTLIYGVTGGSVGGGFNTLVGTYGSLAVNTSSGAYSFTPNAAAINALSSGSTPTQNFTLTVSDGQAGSATQAFAVNLTGANDAPAGTDGNVTINEDGSHVFNRANFGFTDPIDATDDAFLSVKISTLPAVNQGTLTYDGNPVSALDVISTADIDLGKLVFHPLNDWNGATNFTFQVQDNGGIVNSGVDLDQSANTFTINVTPVNDAPVLSGTGTDMPSQTEEIILDAGQTIASLLATQADVDTTIGSAVQAANNGLLQGVAIYGTAKAGVGVGHWEYSIDNGSNWSAVGAVSTSSALLLSPTDKIRFAGDTHNGQTATFDYYAWDQSAGTHGSNANVTTRSGTTAFSTVSDTVSITVTDVNDAPAVDLNGAAGGTGYTVDFLVPTP